MKYTYLNIPFLCIFQELDLSDDAVNRLQTVGLRFCGTADQALPRLRGALPAGIFSVITFPFLKPFTFGKQPIQEEMVDHDFR